VPKRILIATLGTTPAVITEAIDLLDERGLRPDAVWVFTTEDRDVRDSYDLLKKHIGDHYGIKWFEGFPVGAYGDVDNSGAVLEFMKTACGLLKNCRSAGYRSYVCIAGGRKAMSALLALAVQFYGAELLFHVWVPPWVEEKGEINNLRRFKEDPNALNELLHFHTLAPDDRPRFVDIPFLGLFPLLPEILSFLEGGKREQFGSVGGLLKNNGLLDPEGKITDLGRMVRDILDEIESIPPPCSHQPVKHIDQKEPKSKIFLEEWADRLINMCPFICRVCDINWRQGGEKVVSVSPNKLRVFMRLRGRDFNVSLELETTARSSGQLEAARRAVERCLER
jgi:CRISPR-associated protein Csx14